MGVWSRITSYLYFMLRSYKIILAILLSASQIAAQTMSLDSSFAVLENQPNQPYSILPLNDGRYYVGGGSDFSQILGNKIVRVLNDGQIDPTFVSQHFFNSAILSVDTTSNGDVIVGGIMYPYRIVKLNSEGQVDAQFQSNLNSSFDDIVEVVKVQPDGKILVGGQFDYFNFTPVNRLARLNADGTLDESFNVTTGFLYSQVIPTHIECLPDGKILVAKRYDDGSSFPYAGICRLNEDGSIDPTFQSPLNTGSVTALTKLSNGKYLLGGFQMHIGNLEEFDLHLVRIDANGIPDTAFQFQSDALSHNIDYVKGLYEMDENNVVMVYSSTSNYRIKPILVNDVGGFDTTLISVEGFDNDVFCSAIDFDGKILVGGSYYYFDTTLRLGVTRFIYDGSSTGITEVSSGKRINVFPNPTDGQLYFDFGTADPKAIKADLVDALGNRVSIVELGNSSPLDVSELVSGIYCLVPIASSEVFAPITFIKK